MDFSKLKKGQRYLFQQTYGINEFGYFEKHKKKLNGTTEYFNATYLGVNIFNKYTTLVVTNYNIENSSEFKTNNPKSIFFIANTKYISNAFTLVDIIKNENCILPDDVLNQINKFY